MIGLQQTKIDGNLVSFSADAVQRLQEEVWKILDGGTLDEKNVVIIVVNLMQIVETYNDVSGIQKKAVVIEVLNRVIDYQIKDETKASTLKTIVQMTIPSVIDIFVGIDKKDIHIKLQKSWTRMLACCKGIN